MKTHQCNIVCKLNSSIWFIRFKVEDKEKLSEIYGLIKELHH